MPVFLGVHKLPEGMQEADVVKGWGDYKANAQAAGLKPISAVVSTEKGFAYCQTEAEAAEQVRQAHEGASVPLEDVVEVKRLD